jgi:serine/threonine protein kinase
MSAEPRRAPDTEVWTTWQNQVVNGTFTLRRFLGGSNHSAVFLTDYKPMNLANAAIKFVRAEGSAAKAQLALWEAAASLPHPHLLRLFAMGKYRSVRHEYIFIVMEHADQTLAEILRGRALSSEEARELLLPTLDVLTFLHRGELAHGQLQPSNFLAVGDQLKLSTDTIHPAGYSASGAIRTSSYNPPELKDRCSSTAGDIWSLGMTLVEALTQRNPVSSGQPAALAAGLPPPFADTVRRCLSVNPAERPSATQLGSIYKLASQAQLVSNSPPAQGAAPPQQVTPPQAAAPPRQVAPPQETAPPRQVSSQQAAAPARQATPPQAVTSTRQAAPLQVATSAPQATPPQAPTPPRQVASQQTAAPVRQVAPSQAAAPPQQVTPPREAKPPQQVTPPQAATSARQAAPSQEPAPPRQAAPPREATPPQQVTLPQVAASARPVTPPQAAAPLQQVAPPRKATPPKRDAVAADLDELSDTVPTRRGLLPLIAAALLISVGVWFGLRYMDGSQEQARLQPPAASPVAPSTIAKPAASESKPTNLISRPSDQSSLPPETTSPSVLHEVTPDVPQDIREKIRGRIYVTVRVLVGPDGNVFAALMDNPGPSKYFARLADNASRQWQFTPVDEGDRVWLLRFEFNSDGVAVRATEQ